MAVKGHGLYAHGVAKSAQLISASTDAAFDLQEISYLRANLDALETATVAALRRDGQSWQFIADTLGISRQAAHKRFRGVV